jgi:hypothetical protein
MPDEPLKIPISKKLIEKLLRTNKTAVVPILKCPICRVEAILIYPQNGKIKCPKCGESVEFIPVTARDGD